jgi:urea-proton symporter
VSGPFWYASGATIQVLLFAILAIEIKRKCPAIHTVLEVVHARWGTTAHMVFLFFCLLTCLIVTAMLILGGADTINALTGMSVYWANFMIPVPVMIYTAFGGLKGTYYASFTHTAVIYLALLIFLYAFDALS